MQGSKRVPITCDDGTRPSIFSDEQGLAGAFHSTQRIEGLTHRFYRYPARFSHEFVRHVIDELTEPGDTVLDPFMGGGTTIVEALAAGRRAVGVDINGLSHFVTRVKTTPLSERDAGELLDWRYLIGHNTTVTNEKRYSSFDHWTKNLPKEMQGFLGRALSSVRLLRFPRQRRFARCVLLRVGQWALDGRRTLPNTEELCRKVVVEVEDMLNGLHEFERASQSAGVNKNRITGNRELINGSITEPGILNVLGGVVGTPKLVLTSPPYPGVHILYHRWQVFGRRETPAPYWLADLQDGHGASHYTMGSRSILGLRNYLDSLRQGFEALRTVLSSDTIVVQLVAFSEATTQLPLYLDTLVSAGYEKLHLPELQTPGSYLRKVPHRKWYANGKGGDAGHEELMVHRLRSSS